MDLLHVNLRQVADDPGPHGWPGGKWEGPGWYLQVYRLAPGDPGEAAKVLIPTMTKVDPIAVRDAMAELTGGLYDGGPKADLMRAAVSANNDLRAALQARVDRRQSIIDRETKALVADEAAIAAHSWIREVPRG